MGFCLHNNAAIAALAAQVAGARKVLIVDWVGSMFFIFFLCGNFPYFLFDLFELYLI